MLNELQTRVQGDPRIFMMGMRLAEAAGQPEGAVKAARQAVKIAPDWAPAVLDLALLLARQNQFVEAAQQAKRAVELAPGDLRTLRGAIDIAHRAGYVGGVQCGAGLRPRQLTRERGADGGGNRRDAVAPDVAGRAGD